MQTGGSGRDAFGEILHPKLCAFSVDYFFTTVNVEDKKMKKQMKFDRFEFYSAATLHNEVALQRSSWNIYIRLPRDKVNLVLGHQS